MGKCKLKPQRYHPIPIRMAETVKTGRTKCVGEDMEHLELSDTAGEMHSTAIREQSLAVSENVKYILTI